MIKIKYYLKAFCHAVVHPTVMYCIFLARWRRFLLLNAYNKPFSISRILQTNHFLSVRFDEYDFNNEDNKYIEKEVQNSFDIFSSKKSNL